MADQRTRLAPIWKKPLDSAIHLRVFRNGDGNFGGKNVTLNRKHQRTFDSWLGELSNSMKLRSGAVWRVFTPDHGHRVDDFDRLEDGRMIVVAGQERFKPLRYAQIDPNPRKAQAKAFDIEPGHNRRYQVSGKIKKVETHGRIIKCWANGDDTKAPRTVLLPPFCGESLPDVIKYVSGVLCNDCHGAVEKLYLPNGIQVMTSDQIAANTHYVALRRTERFKHAHYKEQSLSNFRTSPRLEKKFTLPPLPRSNKTSSHSSPEHSVASNNGSENSYTQRSRNRPYRRERAKREEDTVFHSRPIKHKRSSEKTRQVDYDKDDAGVFKARSQNNATKGARQIDDSRQTRTELPVDKRPAEQVQEEDVKGKDKKDKKGKKEDQERAFRANSRKPDSPGNEQARRKAEEGARREADDRERAEKAQQQREAAQKKKERQNQKKREEEEERRRKEEEERQWREEEERRRREDEQRRWEEAEEEKRRAAAARTPTSDRNRDHDSNRGRSPGVNDTRSGTELLREEQERLAREEELAAAKIQAGFRGYQARRDLRQRQAEERHSHDRDSSLMRDEPIYLQTGGGHDDSPPVDKDNDWGPGPDQDENQDREAEEQAATTLQAGFRGYRARREVREMRNNQEVKDKGEQSPPPPVDTAPAPVKSPSASAAEDLTETDAEHAAATKIQAAFRGRQTRKDLAAQHAAAEDAGAATGGTEQSNNTQN